MDRDRDRDDFGGGVRHYHRQHDRIDAVCAARGDRDHAVDRRRRHVIRIPYLIEGAILGALGGALSLSLLKLGFEFLKLRLGNTKHIFLAAVWP